MPTSTAQVQTYAPSRLPKGYALLMALLANEGVGVTPHEVVADIERMTGVALRDLKASATSPDRGEAAGIRVDAIERAAYALGRADGASVAARARTSEAFTNGQYLGTLDYVKALPAAANPAYQSAVEAYRKGMIASLSRIYVQVNLPAEWQRQRMEAHVVRTAGDPVGAEALVEETNRYAVSVEKDPGAFAVVMSRRAIAEETADALSEEVLAAEVAQIAAASPKLPTPAVLQQARNVIRSRTLEGPLAQRAYLRAAWRAVSYSAMEMRAREARGLLAFQAEPEASAERTRSRAAAVRA